MNWGKLDWPLATIRMRAETKWEQTYRVNACGKEPWTADWIRSTGIVSPGAVLWDIGASTGPYSLLAAACGLRAVAFEPAPASYGALIDNVLANGALGARVLPLPWAIGSETRVGMMDLSSLEAGAGSHRVAVERVNTPAARVAVTVMAPVHIGALGVPWPDVVKIDVDGGESDVLDGLAAMLTMGVVPREIMIEMPRDASREAPLLTRLAAMGYEQGARYDTRAGHPIEGIYYALWRRP